VAIATPDATLIKHYLILKYLYCGCEKSSFYNKYLKKTAIIITI